MPKTALVTGANRGIGLELCRLLVERGDKVVAACRSVSNALRALDVDIQEGVDVTLESSVGHLVRRLDGMPIDLLINNAGVLSREHLDKLDFEAVKWQFEVNAMGPLRVTHALLSQLPDGAKVGIITSRMGSIADNSSGSRYGYRMSKAAVNIAGVSLAHDLRHRGVAVALLHPGFVKTDMTGGRGTVEPEVAAAGLLARLEALNMENSGSFWHANGEVLPW
jgi:NAD(P)-dependent dehydrogenase (short-subunit alcohol dehydrogenase family)